MYNDYYLQSIDNKMSQANNKLDTIINNQQQIIQYQQQDYSGDVIMYNKLEQNTNGVYVIALIVTLALIYYFIVRSMKA